MSQPDYKYIAELIDKAKRGNSNAFAELFSATFQEEYQIVYTYTHDTTLAQELLRNCYISAFQKLDSLKNPRHLFSWLAKIRHDVCADAGVEIPKRSSSNQTRTSSNASSGTENLLDSNTGNQILLNVLIACNAPPSTIPVSVLYSWKNYLQPEIYSCRFLIYAILGILLLLPLLFVPPSLSAEWTYADGTNHAQYDVHINSILPLRLAQAELNGEPIRLNKVSMNHYKISVAENGTLNLYAAAWNGQHRTRTYEVQPFDNVAPVLLHSEIVDQQVILTLQDTYSGIDYENISGATPDSYDAEDCILVYNLPPSDITLSIPDHAGNILTLTLSPEGVK